MRANDPEALAGLVLAIGGEPWTVRSVESVLRPEGYAVLSIADAERGLALATKVLPDLVLVDHRLPDMSGAELCRRLRAVRSIRASTPIVMLSSRPFRKRDEIEALRAGAWALLAPPFDADEILARFRLFVSAKRDADAMLEGSFLDPLTGFYNLQGLVRRMNEVAADANRSGRPVACVAVGPGGDEKGSGGEGSSPIERADIIPELAQLITKSIRTSDAVGRVGATDFVILAPGTDSPGARRLAERVVDAFGGSSLRAGLSWSSGADVGKLVPEELIRRANAALRSVQAGTEASFDDRIRSFESN